MKLETRKGAIHLVRLGPVNAQRQTHRKGNTAPVSRGMWAFPYGHDDAFFYFHKWKEQLPKRLQDKAIQEAIAQDREKGEKLCEEQLAALKIIRGRYRLTSWWHTGPFYSRISPKGAPPASWTLWINASEWAKAAGKQLWMWHRDNPEAPLRKYTYGRDHLEIFVPATAQNLPHQIA